MTYFHFLKAVYSSNSNESLTSQIQIRVTWYMATPPVNNSASLVAYLNMHVRGSVEFYAKEVSRSMCSRLRRFNYAGVSTTYSVVITNTLRVISTRIFRYGWKYIMELFHTFNN